ncbi:MAG: exodeoxyribonuclease VII small subunit [Clostridia bacterium]
MENVKNFETALLQLEALVKKLEGDIPLDEAVSAFENGIALCKVCMESLKAEKGKLNLLVDDLNKLTEEFKLD